MSMQTYDTSVTVDRCAAECLAPEAAAPLVGRVLDRASAERVTSFFALLSDPARLRILHALAQADELCVCDLAILVESSQSSVSHQLRLLRAHGVVRRRREGRVAFYALDDAHLRRVLVEGIEHALGAHS